VTARLALLTLLVSAGLAGCALGGRPSLLLQAWLPSGDIYYQHLNFDGDRGWTLRRPSGTTTEVDLTDGYAAVSARKTGCRPAFLTFVAPDGGLGQSYDCAGAVELIERDASGSYRYLGSLPSGWDVGWLRAGTALTGVARGSTASPYGNGACHGIEPLESGHVGTPYADVTTGGRTYHVSPPAEGDCTTPDGQTTGVLMPTARRDGSYPVFLMAGDGTDRVWWWPPGAAQPSPVGPALHGVDALSVDPINPRVAVSTGLGKGGVTLIDLPTGATHRLAGGGSGSATFAPDGRRVLYVQGDKLKFVKP
jgi:hypothetical protein